MDDKCPASAAPVWNGTRYRHDRIRLAYLSADLRDHPVAYLLAGLFERHDRSRFETTAISFGSDDTGEMHARLKGAFEHFIDVRDKSDFEIANLLSGLEIDIAVDLMGFTTQLTRQDIRIPSRPDPGELSGLPRDDGGRLH